MARSVKKPSSLKSMRLSEEVISYVAQIAEEQNRSFSNTVETILKTNMEESLNL